MSWLYSQALVEEFLPDTYSDGALSAPSSGSRMQLAYLPPDRMTAFSRLSRFGMTFRPLTADLGEALLTLYLAAFPAKTSAQQAEEPESKESDQACGERWHGWLAKYDHDTSSLRTAQCSLLEGEPELLQILPRSGITLSGTLWERQTLVRRINATESGSWPTPMSSEYKANKNYRPGRQNGLTQAVMKWPTPTVCGNYNRKGLSKTSGDGLATAVSKWPTPTARIWKGGGEDDSERWQESGRYAGLACRTEWWSIEPDVGRVADGVAARVDRLKAIGNGQVPAVAAEAFTLLSGVNHDYC